MNLNVKCLHGGNNGLELKHMPTDEIFVFVPEAASLTLAIPFCTMRGQNITQIANNIATDAVNLRIYLSYTSAPPEYIYAAWMYQGELYLFRLHALTGFLTQPPFANNDMAYTAVEMYVATPEIFAIMASIGLADVPYEGIQECLCECEQLV